MKIIQRISAWAADQPAWIDDAVRRLTAGALTDDDIRELADLAKSSHGLTVENCPAPIRLDPTSLPTSSPDAADVSLAALRHLQNINAVDPTQSLTFQLAGLTVVYGHNGAGKSGYARALKKACRARNVESILPDVYGGAQTQATTSAGATFEWNEGQTPHSDTWSADTYPPPSLSQVSVFDSHCARVFVDNQAKILFVPDGLDVIHGLSAALGNVQRLIEADRKKFFFDQAQLAPLVGSTAVGLALAKISRKSDPEAFRKLATLSGEEDIERQALKKLFSDQDPVKLAAEMRRRAARLQSLRHELVAAEAPLLDGALLQLANAFASMTAAESASKLAAEMLRSGSTHVMGIGTEPWEVLLRSATKYATEVAYPQHEFPGPDGAHCVLCQQSLTPEARVRLETFVKFLEEDSQKKATLARDVTKKLYRSVSSLSFEIFPTDRVFLDELGESHPALATTIRRYIAALEIRCASVMATAAERRLDPQAELPPSPVIAIDELVASQLAEAGRLESITTPEEREHKKTILAELEARVKLADLLPKIFEFIDWYKRDYAFGEAIRGCNTRLVTAIATELYEANVTEELRAAFAKELANLGLKNLDVVLEMTGQKGARMQQLKLQTLPQYARAKVSDILSEGEQRVIAMALFLAEVGIEPGRSGLIFDDPVSSLDHVRRERIASRLVQEAKARQIIVFTHDLAFAWALKDFADKHGVANVGRHIFSAGVKKGVCSEGLPFEAKRLGARINELKEQAKRAKRMLEDERDHQAYNDTVRNCYRRMRDTWELLIEEHLFAGTIKRFRRSIETSKLRYVSVSDEEASAVYKGMSRCSDFTHEGGAEAPPALPEPDEFFADVEELDAAIKLIEKNAKLTEKRRQEEGLAAAASRVLVTSNALSALAAVDTSTKDNSQTAPQPERAAGLT